MLRGQLKRLFLVSVFVVFLSAPLDSTPQIPAPALFFSDLTSGPATGNSDHTYTANGGAYVTLYGNFFGTVPIVTLNGASCLALVSKPAAWMWYQRMVVQLGSACKSGDFIVANANGSSNGIPFTVRVGKIRFVSTTGKDTNAGSFSSPWATVTKAKSTMAEGDITYAENGVSQTIADDSGWGAAYTLRPQWCGSTVPAQSRALVAYPGATVTLGSTNLFAIRSVNPCLGALVFAELVLRGRNEAVAVGGSKSNDWRFVGNDISCPGGKGATACVIPDTSTNIYFLGNNLHEVGASSPPDSLYHAVYIGGPDVGFEIAWNGISNVVGCRAIQIYAGNKLAFHSFSIHDNTIHDVTCDGIGMYRVDPSQGSVAIYNNVIYNAGQGPANPNGGAWTCIREAQSPGLSGTIEIFGNTLYRCGNLKSPPFAGENAGIINEGAGADLLHIQNNLIYQTNSSAPYWLNVANPVNGVYGTNNLMYGIGAPPSSSKVARTDNSDPNFVNMNITACPRTCPTDLHLASPNSPAIGAGMPVSVIPFGANWTAHDHDGLPRPSQPSIGAYEYAATATAVPR